MVDDHREGGGLARQELVDLLVHVLGRHGHHDDLDLVLVFLLVATAYSSVGLGGGSAYIALMVVFGFGSLSIPVVSLTLNIIVTTIGSITFIRRGYLRLYLLLPFLISSLPMAWLGGSLDVPKIIFQWLLLISLLVIVIRIYWWSGAKHRIHINRNLRFIISLLSKLK